MRSSWVAIGWKPESDRLAARAVAFRSYLPGALGEIAGNRRFSDRDLMCWLREQASGNRGGQRSGRLSGFVRRRDSAGRGLRTLWRALRRRDVSGHPRDVLRTTWGRLGRPYGGACSPGTWRVATAGCSVVDAREALHHATRDPQLRDPRPTTVVGTSFVGTSSCRQSDHELIGVGTSEAIVNDGPVCVWRPPPV